MNAYTVVRIVTQGNMRKCGANERVARLSALTHEEDTDQRFRPPSMDAGPKPSASMSACIRCICSSAQPPALVGARMLGNSPVDNESLPAADFNLRVFRKPVESPRFFNSFIARPWALNTFDIAPAPQKYRNGRCHATFFSASQGGRRLPCCNDRLKLRLPRRSNNHGCAKLALMRACA